MTKSGPSIYRLFAYHYDSYGVDLNTLLEKLKFRFYNLILQYVLRNGWAKARSSLSDPALATKALDRVRIRRTPMNIFNI
ncbi:Protein of unknown function [Cotesia congregata]|uniref:Uncharacterized protein n=1 Tax=Cotesia congregata TaxID=51543 RepID=A0A8J2MRC9_COTCN|nr:Protein of unknown function [Cotesia congregata]